MNITVVAIAGKDVDGHANAIHKTVNCLPKYITARKLLFSPFESPSFYNGEHINIPDWGSNFSYYRDKVSEFILYELPKHIETTHCITVQADGYAHNPDGWRESFLTYDFIGAPIPLWECLCIKPYNFVNRVCSSGFCMKSLKWLKAANDLCLTYNSSHQGEDIFSTRIYVDKYIKNGLKIAPIDLALQFCIEHRLEDKFTWNPLNSFGFHGITKSGKRLYELGIFKAIINAFMKSQHFKRNPSILKQGG